MPDLLREAIRAHAFGGGAPPQVREAAAEVARLGGDAVLAVVFFGSRKTRPSDDPWSAHDFFVVTRAYRPFYAALRKAGTLRRQPLTVAALNAWMPPNQVALHPAVAGRPLRAKCAVIALDALLRETSPKRHDHFCAGRLFQPTEVAWWRDEASAEAALGALVAAHRLTYAWVRPFLPEQFDALGYARTALQVSMGQEIRPEPAGRADVLFEAQREYHRGMCALLLAELCEAGELRVAGERGEAGEPRRTGAPGHAELPDTGEPGTALDRRYALARPATRVEGLRARLYFRRSLVRATARWTKYIFTYDDWLDYIVHKVERHSRRELRLSERERRWPFVFLWPRFYRFMRDKDRR